MKLIEILDTIGYNQPLEEGRKDFNLIPVWDGGSLKMFDQYPKYVGMPDPEGTLSCRKFSGYIGSRETSMIKPSPISIKQIFYDIEVDTAGNIKMLGPMMAVITQAFVKGGSVAKSLLKTTAGPYKSAIANAVRDVAWGQFLKIEQNPALAVEDFRWDAFENAIRSALESPEAIVKFAAESEGVPNAFPMATKVLTPLGATAMKDAKGAVSLGDFFANQVTLSLQKKYSNVTQAKNNLDVYMSALLNVASGVWGGRADIPIDKTGDAETSRSKESSWYSDENRDDTSDVNIGGKNYQV